jgi:hypothetical protein
MRKIIELGETLRLYLPYFDVDTGAAVDPLSVTATFRKPDSTLDVVTYPDTDFVRESAGFYFIRVLGDQIGTWRYQVVAQINANDRDVRDGKFDVEPSL